MEDLAGESKISRRVLEISLFLARRRRLLVASQRGEFLLGGCGVIAGRNQAAINGQSRKPANRDITRIQNFIN